MDTTSCTKKFAIVSVWYHENKFVYNNCVYPFWHNVQYNSKKYDYIVLYYIEDMSEVILPSLRPDERIKLINYADMFIGDVSVNMNRLRNKANKIDYMKLKVIFNATDFDYEHVLLMDFDCNIVADFNMEKASVSKFYIEPYFEPNIKFKYTLARNNMFNSYIENYATLINCNNVFFHPIQCVNVHVDKENGNCYMFAQYIQIVQLYYCIFHEYSLPNRYEDLTLDNSILLSYNRGNSWNNEAINCNYDYIYDANEKPAFDREPLTRQLYYMLLNKNETEAKKIIFQLKELNYDFREKFEWSNSLQNTTNVLGVIMDRCESFNLTGIEFIMFPYK
ncbi:ac112 [Malacosoma neustria nucleopolyhedrovirus]|uniref:ac112 n=1 Tax=Malacosoma neustria nuclear polyhedrosis virus TaxID=38012 RepID=UPI000E360BCD|nr:ac112 [Malacosoma neustria nucleopolyhedrovirus]AUF81584.1 ac112 [Malacosoma neustria nucleopolyhedrovirus]